MPFRRRRRGASCSPVRPDPSLSPRYRGRPPSPGRCATTRRTPPHSAPLEHRVRRRCIRVRRRGAAALLHPPRCRTDSPDCRTPCTCASRRMLRTRVRCWPMHGSPRAAPRGWCPRRPAAAAPRSRLLPSAQRRSRSRRCPSRLRGRVLLPASSGTGGE